MQGVTVVDHPLVQHKLTIMRNKETSTAGFRRLLREISLLLGYEVTRNLELTTTTIETPIETMEAPTLEGKKLVFASVLRAGNGDRKSGRVGKECRSRWSRYHEKKNDSTKGGY